MFTIKHSSSCSYLEYAGYTFGKSTISGENNYITQKLKNSEDFGRKILLDS